MAAFHRLLAQGLSSAESYPSSAGRQARQLLQYNNGYNNGYYGNRGYHWSGGRIAGVIVGCVCFGLAILFALLACTLRRRRMARANNAYPVGTYPAAPVQNQAYPQSNQYPQAGTYPNQAYPQNTGDYNPAAYPQNTQGYNPAAYNPSAAYPNTATGTPANEYNGVQMSALPHEKAGYQSNV